MSTLPKLGFDEQTGDLTLQISLPRPAWALLTRIVSDVYYIYDLSLDECEMLDGVKDVLVEVTEAYL